MTRHKIWNIANTRVRVSFKGHTSIVSAVDFSPDGRFLVSASWDCTVRLWRIRDGTSKKLSDDASFFDSVVFSPLGRYVISGNNDGFVRIWNACTLKLAEKWKGDAGIVWCVNLANDGERLDGLVTGGDDMTLKYWDASSFRDLDTRSMEEKKEILRFEGHTVRFPRGPRPVC